MTGGRGAGGPDARWPAGPGPFFLAALLLARCAAAPASPQGFCAAQANRDPAVKALLIQRVSAGNFHETDALRTARASAIAACLKHQGVLPARDGVASQNRDRRDTLFSW